MRFFALPLRKRVSSLAFVPDGSAVTALGENLRFLSTFSIATGDLTRWYQEGFDRMRCFAYSADQRFHAVGYPAGVARAHHFGTTTRIAELVLGQHEQLSYRVPINSLAFAPTSDPKRQWLAVAGGELWLWNAATQQYLVASEQDDYSAVAFAPTADAVFVAHGNAVSKFTLRPFGEVWRVEPWQGAPTGLTELAVSAGGEIVVVSGRGSLGVLSTEGGETRGVVAQSDAPRSIAFVPGTRLLAVADGSPTLRVYDTDNGQLAREYDWGIGGIHSVTFSNDGAMGAAGGDKGKVVVWDVE